MDAELAKSPRSHPAMTTRKRKKPLEEDTRPSHEATPLEQSYKMVECRYPYSPKRIYFKVEPKFCCNGWKYNLDFEGRPHNISRYNLEERFVLTHRKYTITLKEWLENTKNANKWSRSSQNCDVYRPNEMNRQIIRGILRAVYELHTINSFHGFLYHLENFAIYNESVIEGDHKAIKRVFLIHANCKLNQDFAAPNSEAIEEGKKYDMRAVLYVIFTQIINYGSTFSCPKDLQKLRELLEQLDVSSDSWELIVNHPSLWHWKSRFNYIERVWMKFLHADESIRKDMAQEFTNIQDVKGWTEKIYPTNIQAVQGSTQVIPLDTPLQMVFNFPGCRYSPTLIDLLRYLRNLHVHYKQGWHGNPIYLDGEVIELLAARVSELFLVDLYNIMCKLKIKF